METHKRTIAKTISWRLLATVITMSIAWGISKDPTVALSVGLADTTLKLFFFYAHERVWTKISFGYASKDQDVTDSDAHAGAKEIAYPRVHQSRRFRQIRKDSLSTFAWQRQASVHSVGHGASAQADATSS